MKRSSRTLLILSVLWLALSAFAHAADDFDAAAEQQILALVNQARAQQGLQPLQMDTRLVTAARLHSRRMAQANALSHQFPSEPDLNSRLEPGGLHFDVSGENVAVNTSVLGAHQGLMNSPPHRENILNPRFNAIGIGVLRANGVFWVTQDFIEQLPEISAIDAEAQVARQFNELRRAARKQPLPLYSNPKLRELACQMASRDSVSAARAGSLPNVARVVALAAANLSRLPAFARDTITAPASGLSVGACYASSRTYTAPVYWILVATYF